MFPIDLGTSPQNPTSKHHHNDFSEPSLNSYIYHIPQKRHYEENFEQHFADDHYENPIQDGHPDNYDHEEHSLFSYHDWHHGPSRHRM